MIKTAVILAAGLGSRICERSKEHPKGFLKLDGVPIIEISILNLLQAGIGKIVVGTGYRKEDYEKLALKYPQIQCVYNPKYASSGSLHTLLQLRNCINEDFLLLESDLVYEKTALKALLAHEHQDVILASDFTHSGDEVYIEADEQQHLVNMSKKQGHLNGVFGELVGITKLSCNTYQKMCSEIEGPLKAKPKMDYEEGLVEIAKSIGIKIHKLNHLVWCEVDEEQHWTRAVSIVYPMIKTRENMTNPVKRNILLNPGPATTTDTVKYAQIVPDICPREPEFGEIMEFVSLELTKLIANPDEYTTVLFGGSGTAAVEAILSSVVDQRLVVIVNNGAYGKRMCQIAEIYGLNFLEYESPVDDAIDLEQLESFIKNTAEKVAYLAVVHCETTTGLLNDLEVVGKLCKKHSIIMMVDAMSSYAGIPIEMENMNISYLAASSNKILQGMAGVSFVIAEKAVLEKTKEIKPRNLYLNLYEQYQNFIKTKQMRFTPPVQTIYALKQAIIETKWEGIENRYKRYSDSWETLMAGIKRLGLNHLVQEHCHSKIITSIIEPSSKNYNFIKMHDFFYDNGFTIYPGKLNEQNTFRIANIGDINHTDMEKFIALLEKYLEDLKGGDSISSVTN